MAEIIPKQFHIYSSFRAKHEQINTQNGNTYPWEIEMSLRLCLYFVAACAPNDILSTYLDVTLSNPHPFISVTDSSSDFCSYLFISLWIRSFGSNDISNYLQVVTFIVSFIYDRFHRIHYLISIPINIIFSGYAYLIWHRWLYLRVKLRSIRLMPPIKKNKKVYSNTYWI